MPHREPTLAFFRPRERLPEAIATARVHGFHPLAVPLLEVRPAPDHDLGKAVDLLAAGRLNAVVFTSVNAVDAAWRMTSNRRQDLARLLEEPTVVAIGPKTWEALQRKGVLARTPPEHSSAGVARLLHDAATRGQRVALVRSDHGTPELPTELRNAGADVMDVAVYRLGPTPDPQALRSLLAAGAKGAIDAYAFTSSLIVRMFVGAAAAVTEPKPHETLRGAIVGAIGKPTARTLATFGIRCDVIPTEADFCSLVREIRQRLRP